MSSFDLEDEAECVEVGVEVDAPTPSASNDLPVRLREPSTTTFSGHIELAERLHPVAHVENHARDQGPPPQSFEAGDRREKGRAVVTRC